MSKQFAFDMLFDVAQGSRVQQINGATALILGEDVNFLERQLCRHADVDYCVTVPSVETGLYLVLRAAGIQETGQPVLCSGFAPPEVLRAISMAGARPVPVDINPNTCNLDPYCLEYVIGKCIRTMQPIPSVLIASDTFGLPCNYEAITGICVKHGITLIEDMSMSMGASVDGQLAGSFGRFAVTSLSLGAQEPLEGEGAAVFAHNAADEAVLRTLLRQTDTGDGDYLESAGKSSVRATIARERMEEFSQQLEVRQRVAREYRSQFEGHLRMQHIPDGYVSAWSKFVVALPRPDHRERIIARMQKREIGCGIFRTTGWEQLEESRDRVMLANASVAYDRLISLPIYHQMSTQVTVQVAQQLLEEIEHAAELVG